MPNSKNASQHFIEANQIKIPKKH